MLNKSALTRWFFIILSVFIISLILYNTYLFFNQLKERERQKMEIWATAQTEFSQVDLSSSDPVSDLIIQILQSNTTTPMIYKSAKDSSEYNYRNIEEKIPADTTGFLEEKIMRFRNENQPITLTYLENTNDAPIQLGTLYYGNSPLINKIKYYPAVLILIILLFFLAIYFFYKTSKSAEQNKLWAGMAKETAHQIGTPLSSLVGWAEILKSEDTNPSFIIEIEKDIDRLQTITDRFSKIGSVPNLERTDIVSETEKSYHYLKSRSSKLIHFEIYVPETEVFVKLNPQLYSWTIENLVKNGIDAMKGQGTILVRVIPDPKRVSIQIEDTGKGIPKNQFKRIFDPGFTTKKRGWGLGLSLAKRIIQDYHKGRIHVLKSIKNEGTTIEILLPRL